MNASLASRRHLLFGAAAALMLPQRLWARDEDVTYAVLQEFGKISPQDGKIALDLPKHSDQGTSVPLSLTADSPVTPEDYPRTIGIFASGNPRPRVCTLHFTPLGGVARFSTRIRMNGAQDVVAVMETSRGEHWRASERVTVTFGACATAASGDVLPSDWQPTIKIAVPPTAAKGEVITLRTVITHPMETGLRLDEFNAYVPLRIIQHFTCRMAGETLFDMRLEPAIATNPYLAFDMVARKSGILAFEWRDSNGAIYTRTAPLQVT